MTITSQSDTVTLSQATRQTGFAERFREISRLMPDAAALRTLAGDDYTYSMLDRWSDAIAAAIASRMIDRSRPVAIVTKSNITLVPSAIGAMKAGCFFVAIDSSDPDDRVELLLKQSGAALCVVCDDSRLPPGVDLPVIPAGSIPAGPVSPLQAEPNDYLFAVFTSGTTGMPKAVRIRQPGYVLRRSTGGSVGWYQRERVLYAALPGFARAPFIMVNSLLGGATLCAFDARDESVSALAAFIRSARLTSFTITPAQFRRIITLPRDEVDFSSVRRLVLAADVITAEDVEAFRTHFPPEAVLLCAYASTETGLALQIAIDRHLPIADGIVPMGRPVAGVEVRLVGEDGSEVADGEVGELVIRGPDVVDGYWNAPELAAETFERDEPTGEYRFRTGDLARRDASGLYYFAGRTDFRLRIHSRRIDPLEVERAVVAAAPVREAVAVAKPDPQGEPRLVVYVVMQNGQPCVPRDIRAAMRRNVPGWMIPSRIIELPEIPMTPGAKVDRRALTGRADPPREVDSGAADHLEQRLAAIWSRVIGVPVRVDDDYFDDLGGESIVAAHLVTAIEQELGQAIPLSSIIELNTIRKMAAYFRTAPSTRPLAALVQKGTDPTRPPLFVIGGRGGAVLKFRSLAALLGAEQTVYGLHPHGFDLDHFPKSCEEVVSSYATAVREIQPSGPYSFAGYSAGGMLAYLLGRYFELRGEPVALVAALDAPPRTATQQTSKRSRMERLTAQLKRYLTEPGKLRRLPQDMRKRLGAAKRQRDLEQFREEPDENLPEWLRKSQNRIITLPVEGTLGSYTGRVTLFRAHSGIRLTYVEPDLGWSNIAPGGVDVIEVAGDHKTLLEGDVESLATELGRVMAESRRMTQ